jgi:hypothetical protein
MYGAVIESSRDDLLSLVSLADLRIEGRSPTASYIQWGKCHNPTS